MKRKRPAPGPMSARKSARPMPITDRRSTGAAGCSRTRRRSSTAAPAARPATSPTSSSHLHDLSHETWKLERASQGRSVAERAPGTVQIPVVVHVIRKGTGITNGDVPTSQITAQMTVLNEAYAPPARPSLHAGGSVTRTTNATWYVMAPGSHGRDAEPRTRCASAARTTLNIYTANPGGGLLGWATFPSDYPRNPKRRRRRRPQLVAPRRPRRALQPGRHRDPRGRPLAGPVPHVPGRLHEERTTRSPTPPAERSAGLRLPGRPRHLPRRAAGVDPITNFMDYTDDACMNTFSGGQVSRMDSLHQQYRGTL